MNLFRKGIVAAVTILLTLTLVTNPVAASSQSSNDVSYESNLQNYIDELYDWLSNSNQWNIDLEKYFNFDRQQQEEQKEEQQDEPQTERPTVDEPSEEEMMDEKQPTDESANEEQQPIVDEDEAQEEQPQTSDLHAFEQKVIELTNQERQERGLQPLKASVEISNVAREKSQDMANNNYFSHQSPTYGSPFDMMRAFGINYRTAGENIAMGQRSPEQVVDAWMNSEGHRANILKDSFTDIGVGYVEANGSIYWTQMFVGK